MSEDARHFEVQVRVSTHGQQDAVINREYVSNDKMSTDGVAGEIWAGVSDDVKAKCRAVNDGG